MTYDPTTWVEGVTKVGPTNLNHLEQGLAAIANGGSVPSVGPTSPTSHLTAGTEYVWFETDGSGTLLDIVTGVA